LVRRLRADGYDVSAPGRDALDITDAARCKRLIRELRPSVVVDCSDRGDAPAESAARGAANLAAAASTEGALSVLVSCAEIFSGLREAPYFESDAPDPVSDVGRAKFMAERAVASANPRHAIVRSSWLYGLHGESFVTDLLAEAGESERVEADASVRSSPTYVPHLADALVRLVRNPAYGIFHAAAGGSCTKLRFARTLFRSAGLQATPVSAAAGQEAGVPESRQLVLATRRRALGTLPEWQLGLAAYIEDRAVQGARRRPGPDSPP
jgi:dTDP-4-dehydrorhamnose reductase